MNQEMITRAFAAGATGIAAGFSEESEAMKTLERFGFWQRISGEIARVCGRDIAISGSILSEIDQQRIQAEIGFVESLRAYAQELINLEKGMTDEQES